MAVAAVPLSRTIIDEIVRVLENVNGRGNYVNHIASVKRGTRYQGDQAERPSVFVASNPGPDLIDDGTSDEYFATFSVTLHVRTEPQSNPEEDLNHIESLYHDIQAALIVDFDPTPTTVPSVKRITPSPFDDEDPVPGFDLVVDFEYTINSSTLAYAEPR